MLPEGEDLGAGIYRLIFDVASYYAAQNIDTLYPVVEVTCSSSRRGIERFHAFLSCSSPNGYTTYRGNLKISWSAFFPDGAYQRDLRQSANG